VVETSVWMRAYGPDEVERYVWSGIPRDRAGAYGIQDRPFQPVERIDGCLANVVGLPLCEVRRALTAIDPERAWTDGWHDDAASGDPCRLCERALDG
jgi:septum formation protein